MALRLRLAVDGEVRDIEVSETRGTLLVRIEGAAYRVRVLPKGDSVRVRVGRTAYEVRLRGAEALLADGAHRLEILEVAEEPTAEAEGTGISAGTRIEVRPPMPGRVVRVAVANGERVRKGQTLLVLEAMKMQNEIPAPASGTVRDLRISEGETISADRVVASIEVLGRSAS